ncbi:MAG: tetratricopeptide repeat protein [Nostoc sp. TH1S01]|nr:tetratricopeptide repeat protein [Nostoc sp. TH1S01]
MCFKNSETKGMSLKFPEIGQAIQYLSKDPKHLFNQAERQVQEGDYQSALDSLDQALGLNPRNPEFWYLKGKILAYHLKEAHHAPVAFDKALKFAAYNNKFRKKIFNNRGNVLKDLGRNEEAVTDYHKALRIDSSYWQARKGWGALIFSRFYDYSTALAKLDEGFPLSQAKLKDASPKVRNYHQQGCGQLHRTKGKIHYKHGLQQADPYPSWEKAKTSYEQALRFLTAQVFPKERIEIIEELIQVFLALGQIKEAEHLLREGSALLDRLLMQTQNFQHKRMLTLEFTSRDA